MAHFTKIWPAGITGGVTTGSASQFAQLDANVAAAVNGDGGGTWAPSSPIVIGGQGITPTLAAGQLPTFQEGARTKVVSYPITVPIVQTGWAMPTIAYWLVGGGQVNLQQINLPHLVHGATLVSLQMLLRVAGPHVGVPAVLPNVQIARRALPNAPAADSLVTLAPSAIAFPTPGSAAAWDASFNVQSWTYTATQNNVIDTSAYVYYLLLQDENGANALGSNEYVGYKITYSTTSLGIGVG